MNFHHDLAVISKKELHKEGIKVPKEWDDYQVCMKYLELHHRWFNSSVPYISVFSRELWKKLPFLTREEQAAIYDIMNRLRTCQPLTPYMSRDIHAVSVKKSDFLLKNWNIYHLHLEKTPEQYTNPNLLFSSPGDKLCILLTCVPTQRVRRGLTGDCSTLSMITGPICLFTDLISDQHSLSLTRVSTNC